MTPGLPPSRSALRICRAVAVGNACLRSAAPPAMVGLANEVPLAKFRMFGAAKPCPKDATALATSPGAERPSAVGPRELNKAVWIFSSGRNSKPRSEEHTSELQSRLHLVCRLLLEK